MIVLDADGTLLDPSSQLPEQNVRALMRYQERGGLVVLSTGKLFHAIEDICRVLDLKTPQICGNGYLLIAPDGQIVECMGYLDSEQKKSARHVFESVGLDYMFYGTQHIWYEQGKVKQSDLDKLVALGEVEPEPLPKDEIDNLGEVIKILAFCEDTGIEDEARKIADRNPAIRLFRSSFQFIEIVRPEVNKGLGLKKLLERLDIKPEEVVAIGDGENDIEMFEVAGLSVAMGQSEPHVKEAADIITASNAEAGVAKFLEEQGLV
jgi:Cof subfamily protein (haloacid dehalogenase superfamily)